MIIVHPTLSTISFTMVGEPARLHEMPPGSEYTDGADPNSSLPRFKVRTFRDGVKYGAIFYANDPQGTAQLLASFLRAPVEYSVDDDGVCTPWAKVESKNP